MSVRVQESDFDVGAELDRLTQGNKRIGGLAVFVGLVREMHVREGLHRERIVLVAVGSPHREAAFEACAFLVDWLKTKAPFWKLEETPAGDKWVGAHEGDDAAAARWEKTRT